MSLFERSIVLQTSLDLGLDLKKLSFHSCDTESHCMQRLKPAIMSQQPFVAVKFVKRMMYKCGLIHAGKMRSVHVRQKCTTLHVNAMDPDAEVKL